MQILKYSTTIILFILVTTIKTEDAPENSKPSKEGDTTPTKPPKGKDKPPGKEDPPGEIEVARCSKALLEAYDVESGWNTVKDQNFLCPSIKKFNCCSYHGQLDIYRKWVLKGEKKNIVDHYR